MTDVMEVAGVLFQVAAEEGKRLLNVPVWFMPLLYVMLTGMAGLTAYRTRHHPSRLRRGILLAYALASLLALPARAYDQPGLARVVFTSLSVALLYSVAHAHAQQRRRP